MAALSDFRDVMLQSVTIKARSSNDGYDATYGTGTAYSCYVQEQVKNIRRPDGTEAVSETQVYLDGSVVPGDSDVVVWNGGTYPIQLISRPFDEDNNRYATIIYL